MRAAPPRKLTVPRLQQRQTSLGREQPSRFRSDLDGHAAIGIGVPSLWLNPDLATGRAPFDWNAGQGLSLGAVGLDFEVARFPVA